MPNILIKVPEGAFDAEGVAAIGKGVTAAAKTVEQIGDEPMQEFTTWVVVEEVEAGRLFAGGNDPTARVIPVIVFFHPPAGVIDEAGRAQAVRLVHEAIAGAKRAGDPRVVMTSVFMADVPDGAWGVNGQIWRLPDIARAAGYKHLRGLVEA
jgi:phenylpyruvate tautomerase PptA (4-oxalocrotonate tautomerase family)